jgi:DNA-binding MarR family transcriptional regulator
MDRPELGALLSRLLQEVVRREQPLLDRAGLPMWDYVILNALSGGDASTQAELSAATGRDKTRLIDNLDRLEQRGLVTRTPDPGDRRNRIVSLTADGRQVVRECHTAISAMEEELLAGLPPAERAAFEHALVRLVNDIPAELRPQGWPGGRQALIPAEPD